MKRWYLTAILALAISEPPGAHASDWRVLQTPAYTLNNKQDAIAFVDAKTGWFGNGTGRIYRTDDGGTRWTKVWEKRGTYVRTLGFVDRNVGFMGNVGPGYFPNVADKRPLYRTRDGGANWQPVKPASGPAITGICAIDVLRENDRVIAVRAGGRVGGPSGLIESFDGGETWTARDLSAVTGMILDIKFVSRDVGFLAGATEADEEKARARILKTTDGGATWRVVHESDRTGDNNWKLAFPNAQIGYGTIISYQAPDDEARGYIVKTQDGGETWRKIVVTNDTRWIPYGVAFVDDLHGFVGGLTGGYETRDGGETWTRSDMGASVNKFAIVPQGEGRFTAVSVGQDVRKLEQGAR